ncbi:hypothetical protein [Novosphingobium aerophilum]|uniref:Uncharacterized protein n=1 Tax=Novosphingobium aerophilum TaxID=2839843 RepID=A0A7X1FAX4_9SPHN|nr:hypothetical protein [Novosphingobium aerophilum]MBC2653612.1 hypothetical protein [Novosphingobium aerophilum]
MHSDPEAYLLLKTVARFASARFEALADIAANELKAMPAIGIMGDDLGLGSVWEEYAYDQQNGPVRALEMAWSGVTSSIIDRLVADLPKPEATLLTFYCCWDCGDDPLDTVGDPPDGFYPEALATAVAEELQRAALNCTLPDIWLYDGEEEDE